MAGTANTRSWNEAGEPGARLRGARASGHLARVAALAVAALIAAQWLAVHLPPAKAEEPERPSQAAAEFTDATGLATHVTGAKRLAGAREQEKSA